MINSRQVSKININGYKSIKECSIDLKSINVIIGSNGSGKSNFISVFRLLQDIINLELQKHILAAGGAAPFLFNGPKNTSEIDICFEFGMNNYGFSLSPTENNSLMFLHEYFSYCANGTFSATLGSGHLESKWKNGSSYPNINQYVQKVLKDQTWRVFHFHDTSKNARIKQAHNISNNYDFQYDAGNIAAYLLFLNSNYKDNYNNIVKTIQLIAPYFSDFVLKPFNDKGDIVLRWRQSSSDDVFNANQFSDGTLRFICLATLLLQPENLQPETIIIDEPELGLHPYAITVFSEMIKKISDKKQIILSTQSVELLSEFDAKDVIVVDRDEDGSNFKRLDEGELKEWLDNDYSLGELWKKNILGGRLSK